MTNTNTKIALFCRTLEEVGCYSCHGEGCNACSGQGTVTTCPDYLNDLNAMHEAEKMLEGYPTQTGTQFSGYVYRLIQGASPSVVATARERAEAFVKTL